MGRFRLILILCLTWVCSACDTSPRSGYGFRLPDGDPDRGAAVFEELGCRSCHDLAAEPAPSEPRTVGEEQVLEPLTLGGLVTRVETYGELVTSVINPSHEISSRLPEDRSTDPDTSPMLNFNDQMTVAQLIDLIAFLHSQYEARPGPTYVR